MDAARPQSPSQARAYLQRARLLHHAPVDARITPHRTTSSQDLPPSWALRQTNAQQQNLRPITLQQPSSLKSRESERYSRERQRHNELLHRQRQSALAQKRKAPSPRTQRKIAEALETIKLYNKAPFILAYTLIITSIFLGMYQLIAVGILGAPNLLIEATFGQIPGLGKLINFFSDVLLLPLAGLSIGIQLFIGMLQIVLSLYLFYFRLTYSSFMRRYMTRRLLLAVLQLFNIVPLIPLVNLILLYQLQQNLQKKAKKAKIFLTKQRVAYMNF